MLPEVDIEETAHPTPPHVEAQESNINSTKLLAHKQFNRRTYTGALILNLASFILPALYGTLSKLWVANIDSSFIVTTGAALDRPDVPLIISSVKFAVNIILDLLLISKIHFGSHEPTVNMQGGIQLACNLASAFIGLAYILWRSTVQYQKERGSTLQEWTTTKPHPRALLILFRPGVLTFIESAIRNALYLWLVSNILSMGSTYATAWGVFNTIRWGLVMVPVQALEQTSLAFVGHTWGDCRREIGVQIRRPKATKQIMVKLTLPALVFLAIAFAIEVPVCLLLTYCGARPFARYLSGSDEVADVTAMMWRTIDWCYIFYAMSTMLATILLATRPRWYLLQSLVSNMLYVLPWAILLATKQTPKTKGHLNTAQLLLGLKDGDLLVRVHLNAARGQAVQQLSLGTRVVHLDAGPVLLVLQV
ncbi:hypothetical protein OOU_Y34scaffold01179g4 [Pyricularia oryzae Y34]|uniref:Uncharacterized protein n=1 Tax=Pyricularia oryzae (strain Y34) TaxID=1143189 RepID=A0AA97PF78_PYRO3|nr:hypothetical protein OOU_Y34scaffold01179g4 [Pyricularia oryzae Y34]